MSRSTFRVLFYLKRNAPKKNGMIPVMCRITVNGKVSQFSSKLDVEEKMWNVELGKLTGRSLVAQEGNRMLDKIRLGINKAYQEVCDTDGYVTAEKVRNAYLGLGQNHKTLLAVFKQHNEDYAKQVGKMVMDYQVDTESQYGSLDDQNNGTIYWGETNYFTEISQDDLLAEYDVQISPMIIAEIYILGIGVVFISILIPSFMIMRFNPKKILMNQN